MMPSIKISKNASPWGMIAVAAMLMLWNATILGVTAYAVFWLGHSGWWFALALVLLMSWGE